MSVGPSAYWYLTRSTGAVSMLLLTGAVALGVVEVRRWATVRWPRFAIDSLHRSISLLSLAFVAVHVITSVLDSFAPISLGDVFIPFTGSYRPLWLGLGAVAFDLLIAVIVTSLLRGRLGHRGWRAVHWLAYASWPVALLHGLGTGSDVRTTWMLALTLVCVVAVLLAVLARTAAVWRLDPTRARAALGVAGAFLLFLAIWVPTGPLAAGWARRAGTPANLLAHPSAVRASSAATTPVQGEEGEDHAGSAEDEQ